MHENRRAFYQVLFRDNLSTFAFQCGRDGVDPDGDFYVNNLWNPDSAVLGIRG